MDSGYEILFSVVMAVYNVEPFLNEAVDSLINQTIGFNNIQLIMVDDGSTDRSGSICDEYAVQYPNNVIVIHKENGGVASARNTGLKYAYGKYINFMDSDDKFSPDAFEKVATFFDKNENSIDIATIPIFFFDAQHGEHWQNDKFTKGTRVLDLFWEYKATLMFVNASFFHNRVKSVIHFDSKLVCGEDIKVILSVLPNKMKLGVVSECKYMYRRRSAGEESLIQSSKKKYGWYFDYFKYLIDWAVDYYNTIYGYLPEYLQYELTSDLQWRFRELYDFETILSEREIVEYKQTLSRVLSNFDDKYIMEQKMLWPEHKCQMLSYKYGKAPTLVQRESNVIPCFGNTKLISFADQYAKIENFCISDNKFMVEGYTKIFGVDEDEPIDVYIKVNDEFVQCQIIERSDINEYRLGELIYRGIQFYCTFDLLENSQNANVSYNISFAVKFKNCYVVKRDIRFGKFCPIGKEFKNSYYFSNGWLAVIKNNSIFVKRCGKKGHIKCELKLLKELWKKNEPSTRKAVFARIAYYIFKVFNKQKIWLISDRAYRAGDNGEALFQYTKTIKENNRRILFVLEKDSKDFKRISKIGETVDYLSWAHKFLYLVSNTVISSQGDELTFNPLGAYVTPYRDFRHEIKNVFLQHGITQNDVSRWYNYYKTNISGFVVSAMPEYKSIVGNYYYTRNCIWLTGMPRLDLLHSDDSKIITIMPTWRAYLVENNPIDGRRTLCSKFEESNFFKSYCQLLSNSKLYKLAKTFGYSIQFVCHPNMNGVSDKFKSYVNCADIDFIENVPSYADLFAETSLLITDYSSVAFDFAYLKKPILYYQPDYHEFFSGKHTLVKGYFDYESEGFGEVVFSEAELISLLNNYLENECKMKETYINRVENFFAYNDNSNSKRVYEKIVEHENDNPFKVRVSELSTQQAQFEA